MPYYTRARTLILVTTRYVRTYTRIRHVYTYLTSGKPKSVRHGQQPYTLTGAMQYILIEEIGNLRVSLSYCYWAPYAALYQILTNYSFVVAGGFTLVSHHPRNSSGAGKAAYVSHLPAAWQ